VRIVVGLDQDYLGQPWGPSTARRRRIHPQDARHLRQMRPARQLSQRIFESEERVAVGATGMYAAAAKPTRATLRFI